jgi:hypothetical protein
MDFEKSSIERLKRTLYSRDERIVPKEKRTPVEVREQDVPTGWETPKNFDISVPEMTKKNNSFFNKFLLGSVVFFFLSLGVALFIFFGGLNMISSDNLDIKVTSPSSISSGEELLADLTIVNGNRTDLEDVRLFITYPDGAMGISSSTKPLSHEQIDLDTIAKGGSKDYSIRALLFGEKDVIKNFSLRIEYKVKGSNAVFSKEKTFGILIGSSPVLLDIDYPKEVNSGQEVKLSIHVTSNSSVLMKNSLVKIEYPYGFTYKNSNIKPFRDNSLWNIGDLKDGDQKTLEVTGILVGQNMEDRSFRISAGTQTSGNNDFDITLAESSVTVGIRKSFFDLEVVPQESNGLVSLPGKSVPISIRWQNTLPDKIINTHIEATISGNAFDRSAVNAGGGGFYRSVDNTIAWDKNGTNSLDEMMPGEGGSVPFSVGSFGVNSPSKLTKNPHIDVHVVMTGDRSGPNAEKVSSTGDITVKILSTLTLGAKVYRTSGPFTNSGPVPPQADKESTYTVTWTLTNTTNDLKDTIVKTTLPAGVVWKSEVSPASERVNFDPDTRTVSWNIGNVGAGTGFTNSPKTVSFKLGITPSVNQIGLTPSLTQQSRADATDTYAGAPVSSTLPDLTTQYSDANYKAGDNIVVK